MKSRLSLRLGVRPRSSVTRAGIGGHRLRRPRPIAPGDEGRNARRPYRSLYGPWSGALTAVGQFDDDVDFEAVEVAEVEVEVEVESLGLLVMALVLVLA